MRYASRVSSMKRSEIRELLKENRPGVIAFAAGYPDPNTFPQAELSAIIYELVMQKGDKSLQYGPTEGYSELRKLLAEYLKKEGINVSPENITTLGGGSQQGLALLCKIFLDPKSSVGIGRPAYLGMIGAVKSFEGTFLQVPNDNDGLKIDTLEERMKQSKENLEELPRLLYFNPDFANPSGEIMSEERRIKSVDVCKEFDIPGLEDDPYSKLSYEGEVQKPIKSFDKNNTHIILTRTGSKLISPGLRFAYIVASDEIMEKIITAKQHDSLCCSPLIEMTIYGYLARDLLEKHIEEITPIYKEKRDIMLEALDNAYLPEGTEYTRPKGGLFVWMKLPEKFDTTVMIKYGVEKGVTFVPGSSFFPDGTGKNYLRLNFTYPEKEDISIGIKRLNEVIQQESKRVNT